MAAYMGQFRLEITPKFNGTDVTYSSTRWIREIEGVCKNFNFTSRQMLIAAKKSLTGTAELWLRSEDPFQTYEEFKAAIIEEFPSATNKEVLRTSWVTECKPSAPNDDGCHDNSCVKTINETSKDEGVYDDETSPQTLYSGTVQGKQMQQEVHMENDNTVEMEKEPTDLPIALIFDIPATQRPKQHSEAEQATEEKKVLEDDEEVQPLPQKTDIMKKYAARKILWQIYSFTELINLKRRLNNVVFIVKCLDDVERWILLLDQYDIEVEDRPGRIQDESCMWYKKKRKQRRKCFVGIYLLFCLVFYIKMFV